MPIKPPSPHYSGLRKGVLMQLDYVHDAGWVRDMAGYLHHFKLGRIISHQPNADLRTGQEVTFKVDESGTVVELRLRSRTAR